jgi:SAM-dependent methyltransferase
VEGAGGRGPHAAGEIRFNYAGSWRTLLGLRTVVAVHAVVAADLPRPGGLLDDGRLRQIAAAIGHIRSLHPAGAFKTFRVSAAGVDSPTFSRFRERITDLTGLVETDGPGDVLLRCRRGPDGRFELLARISPRPLTARPWRVCNLPGALNACVAAVMADLTQPSATDVYLNLACGSGTLLVERAAAGPAGRLIGCDLAPDALACAERNVAGAGLSGVELEAWDATALPLADGSVDALTVDLPFGQLVGSHTANETLYPRLLAEAARVARPGARLVAISHQSRLLDRAIDGDQWDTERTYLPRLPTQAGTMAASLVVLRRR